MPRLLLVLASAVAVTAIACEGGSESNDDLLSYQLALTEVQEAVGGAGFGIAEGLLEFEVCVTDQECGDAMLLVADEYVPYVAILDDQIRAMNELDPPIRYQSFHDNYTKQLSLRKEAGELWIDGIDTLDEATAVELLTLSQEKFRESQVVYLDILDDLQELFGENDAN